ncbi:hypothetical protein Tco_0738951 [Tanacetum coccineum]
MRNLVNDTSHQASGSGDRVGSHPKVPDELQDNVIGTNEGIGTIPRVPNVPKDQSKSENESWGESGDDDDRNNDDSDDDNDDDSDNDGGNNDSDDERTYSDEDENPNLNQNNDDIDEEYEEEYVNTLEKYESTDDENEHVDEEEYDRIDKELYKDVNVELKDVKYEEEGKGDAKMTDAGQDNVTQEKTYDQDKDEHLQLGKTEVPLQSSSVSSDFATKFLNLDNVSPTDTEINSMMNIDVRHKEPSSQTPLLLTLPVLELSELKQADQSAQSLTTIKSQIPIIVDAYLGIRLGDSIQKALRSYTIEFKKEAQAEKKRYIDLIKKSVKDIINDEVKTQLHFRFSRLWYSDFANSYAVASLTEFKLKKILIDKMEKSQSNLTADEYKELYKALVNSYNVDKDLFLVYGKAVSLKRGREDKDKDEDPHVGSDHGMKRMKTSKDVESSKGSKSKESKSTSSSKGTTHSHPKSSGNKIVQEEKPPLSFDELISTHIDFSAYVMNHLKIDNLIQDHLVRPAFNLLKGTCRRKKYSFDLSKPLPLIMERGRQVVPVDNFINNDLGYLRGGSSNRKYTTSITKTKAAKYDIQGIKDMVPSLWSPVKVSYDRYVVWEISHWGPKRQRFYGFVSNKVYKHDVYSTKRIIVVTKVKVMKWNNYGYLEEIEVRREDQQLYKFKEGDFPRLHLHDIKDMLLFLVQKKLSNLERDVIFDLGLALRMFTRRIFILKRVEDLQLGVKSYQKKLNITKPETFRSDISNRIPYTACNNPQGIIYKDKYKRNKLIRMDELYKFSDGTLTSVRSVLHDINSNLRMDYLPKRR